MLYFAYGANLNLRGMRRRCPRATALSVATLKGYRLEFRGFVTIATDASAAVPGALYKLTPACWRTLEIYEGDGYEKIEVTVETAEGPRVAAAYIMSGGTRAAPTLAYFSEIARGYTDWKLDQGPLRRARIATLRYEKSARKSDRKSAKPAP